MTLSLVQQRQVARGEALAAFFDTLADKWDRYRRRNAYYHRSQHALFRTYVAPGSSVLELGCATGDLLAKVKPARGVGVDLSPRMVEKAQAKYPALHFIRGDAVLFDTSERFDYVMMNNLLEYVDDIQGLFRNCRRLLKPRGRILISNLNPLWTPLVRLGARLGLGTPDTRRNFVTGQDVANLLHLNGFEVVYLTRRTLLPKRLPPFTSIVNLLAALTPLLRRLCMTEFVVARPTSIVGQAFEPATTDRNVCPTKHSPEARGKMDYSVSVIVPCYNEAGNIEKCVGRVPRMGRHTEVIVVDDGSQDGTAARVRPELNPDVEVRCIAYQPNRGKLHAVRTGFDAARGDILMILDADMTVPPEDLSYFYLPLQEGVADFINGTRLIYPLATGSMKMQNFLGNKLFGVLVSWLTQVKLSDTLCGTKAFFREDFHKFIGGYDPWGDFDWLFGAAQNARKILEVPIHYEERHSGQSKMKALKHSWILLKACWSGFWRIKYPPS